MPYKDPEKQRQYQREWCAKRRAEYLRGKSCIICSSTENLEVDHIDPSSKISHNVWSWSEARREEELDKCQILCQVHHFEKTAAAVIKHGTLSRYRDGCDCDDCSEGAKEAMRLDNLKRKESKRLWYQANKNK